MRIRVYYETSKQNDREWYADAKDFSANDYIVKYRRSEKAPPISVAYEHIRAAPKSEFFRDGILDFFEKIMNDNATTKKEMTCTVPLRKLSSESVQSIFGDGNYCDGLLRTPTNRF